MSKSECAIVLAAKQGDTPSLTLTLTLTLTSSPILTTSVSGHVGVVEMLLDIPVKCLRKHGSALSDHIRSKGGMPSKRLQDCANLVEEGYLKDELFTALERNDVAKAKKILEEALESPTGLNILSRPQVYLDATEQPRTDVQGTKLQHQVSPNPKPNPKPNPDWKVKCSITSSLMARAPSRRASSEYTHSASR